MAYTESQRAALQAAIGSGELSVEYDGKRVVYRSITELRNALALVTQGLAAAAGTVPIRRVKIYATKDL